MYRYSRKLDCLYCSATVSRAFIIRDSISGVRASLAVTHNPRGGYAFFRLMGRSRLRGNRPRVRVRFESECITWFSENDFHLVLSRRRFGDSLSLRTLPATHARKPLLLFHCERHIVRASVETFQPRRSCILAEAFCSELALSAARTVARRGKWKILYILKRNTPRFYSSRTESIA